MKFLYPQGKRKALTFSYDDGQKFDARLVEIFNAHGMKGTFHLNSGRLGIKRGKDDYVEPEDVKSIYAGHEVACHGVEHRNLPTLTKTQAFMEIGEDRKTLEKLTGGLVQGMSYAYGNYSEETKQIARMLGIKYSRTVKSTGRFAAPTDFLEWNPTCHHKDNLMELGEKFLNVPGWYDLPVMYVWGHSFEFGWPDDWSIIEKFTDMMAGKEDIWYASNMEICDYVCAVRAQEFSADGKKLHNPCALAVWIETSGGILEIKAGETAVLERD